MVKGDYVALLDHDDILHPCALWYVAQAIAEQGADFVYTDEVTFEGDIDHLTVYHFKPDYMLDNLRSNNYICHLSVFSAALLAKVGGDERAEFNGSQDYDLYLRLTEQAKRWCTSRTCCITGAPAPPAWQATFRPRCTVWKPP